MRLRLPAQRYKNFSDKTVLKKWVITEACSLKAWPLDFYLSDCKLLLFHRLDKLPLLKAEMFRSWLDTTENIPPGDGQDGSGRELIIPATNPCSPPLCNIIYDTVGALYMKYHFVWRPRWKWSWAYYPGNRPLLPLFTQYHPDLFFLLTQMPNTPL